MRRVQVKICGVTTSAEARAAVEAGADAIGLVFHPPSRRAVDRDAARRIADALPPFVSLVGLFVDADPERVAGLAAELPLSLLQFHGAETAADCECHGRPYIRALAVATGFSLAAAEAAWPRARALLLDGPGGGGAGAAFDWRALRSGAARRHVVAGGLDPGNVAGCIATLEPAAVDVSSGVEAPGAGAKSAERMRAFVAAVRRAERALEADA